MPRIRGAMYSYKLDGLVEMAGAHGHYVDTCLTRIDVFNRLVGVRPNMTRCYVVAEEFLRLTEPDA